jgi:outer membrane protein TolC
MSPRACAIASAIAASLLAPSPVPAAAAPASGAALPVRTFEECLALADSDGTVRAARAAVDAALAGLAEARAGAYPSLTAEAGLSPVYNRAGDALVGYPPDHVIIPDGVRWGPYFLAYFTALQPLFAFGRVAAARESARAAALAAGAAVEMARNAVRTTLIDAWVGAWADRVLLDSLDAQMLELDSVRADVDALIASGADPDLGVRDRYRLDVAAENLRADRARAGAAAATHLAALAALVGAPAAPADELPAFAAPPPAGDPGAADAALARALDRRPELRVLRLGVDERRAAARLAERALFPRFSLDVDGGMAVAPGIENQTSPVAWDPYNGIGIGVTAVMRWSFAPGAATARIEGASAEIAAARLALRAAERTAATDVAAAWNDALAAAPRLDAARRSLAAARRWARAVDALEAVGLAGPDDRWSARSAVARYERDVAAAEAEHVATALRLSIALGEDLSAYHVILSR